jgi:hypothetical protein
VILRLEAERKRLQRDKQHKGEEIKSACGGVAVIDSELTALEQNRVAPEAVAAVTGFDRVWEVRYPAEHVWLLRLLVERAETSSNMEGCAVQIGLRLHSARAASRVA